MTPEEFRRAGHELIDWIADYRARVVRAEFPVVARTAPGSLRNALPAAPPQQPEEFAAIRRDLDTLILPACTHWQDPRFHGFFPSNGLPAAVLGDLVSTGLGQLGLNWQASPALTELEEVCLDWWRQMLGLSSSWSGVIQDTASTATLVALVCARERATAFGATRGGLQGQAKPLAIYLSAQAHSSVEKAALLAGFGRDHLHTVPVDANYDMQADALAAAIANDRTAGREPCAIVATCGSTAVTAFDPLARVAEIAARERLWLHVDAAMAGSAMILPECRALWDGVEGADSLVVNPHKWLGVSMDCSTYFVRDAQFLVRVMSTNPSYLQTAADGQVKNYRDWGIPLGRRMRALKLWFVIREQGVTGLQVRIRRDLAHARWLAAEVERSPQWRRLAPVRLQTLVLRHEPHGLDAQAIDAHTRALAQAINDSGEACVTPAVIADRWGLRVSFGTAATEHEHVVDLWRLMREKAAEIQRGTRP
ncbi:MAG TPA: pyridoxal-dependent decarboxylase [Steroidobacteraceae bacterium]|jgi:aromatic-L-amino-acid decarboxylase|nr:pyridoxal-dependent decarboxylase [Steroidobacteraceae bacterium]